MEIINTKIGTVGSADLAFVQGSLQLTINIQDGALTGSVGAKVDSDVILDAIAKAIPGSVDDAVIAVIKTALKNI